ncbi:HDIG domain-containing protein [Bradyrhizobium erythrophlei]|jgi:putative nucleotidyltransferase with HDIG domain|uniref:HDIG domain-containing protein n=2 Tax=Bradyrhizobium erythrophlei TaxID=1437360 RepID=A0A1M7UX73_9BRAD|nr:HDIG domain-containing protein [Bradyrhizobium erythrophlei]
MRVCYLTDEPSKIPAIRAMLEPHHLVVPRLLGDKASFGSDGVLMVDADLRVMARVEQIKVTLSELRAVTEKLFVVQKHLHHMVAQAYALGATSIVRSNREIGPKLAQIEAAAKASAAPEANSGTARPEIVDCARAFATMFSAINHDQSIDLSDAERATARVIAGIERDGLGAWLDDVRRYHEGTFQHCMLVTGIAVGFAIEIGFTDFDIKRLGMAATLHDIGKARIPLSILDKPGRLDPKENEIMRQHPAIGHELLKALPDISQEILDGVRHHHEYLDGTGYPDGLSAGKISDLVRLLTISDIFAALIESRPYRPPMPRQDAYKILSDMDGKLETPLVKAFRNVALVA